MKRKKTIAISAAILIYTFVILLIPGDFSPGIVNEYSEDKVGKDVFVSTKVPSPPVPCLYFDEPSFLDAVASAVVYEEDVHNLKGGIVPHHLLACDMMASFWKTVSRGEYELVVIIGPDHNRIGKSEITTITSAFSTIYGDVEVDKTIADHLILENLALEDPVAMKTDHAVSSHIPFVKYFMPETSVLPILIHGNCGTEKIAALTERILDATKNKKTLFVASIDFSHYLSLEEANKMDEYTERAFLNFDYYTILKMTNDHLDSRPSALFHLRIMSESNAGAMTKWEHSNSDIVTKSSTGHTTSYFVFGFFEKSNPMKSLVESDKYHIIAVGDIMLGRGVYDELKSQGLSFSHPFMEVSDILNQGDILFGNLEHPITDCKDSLDGRYKYILRCEPDAVSGLRYAGFNLLSLANNHIMDFYESGLSDTMRILNENDIVYAGAGPNLAEARKAAIIEINGIRTGLLAYTDMAETVYRGNPPICFAADDTKAGVAPLIPAFVEEDIKNIRDKVDLLILSLHWGVEDSFDVTAEQTQLAHQFCDAGADLILGHHPHRVQGFEIYNGKPIIYSLGNFLFDQPSPESRETFILNITYENNTLFRLKAIPVRAVNNFLILPQKGSEVTALLENQYKRSLDLGTECRIEDGCLVIDTYGK